VNIQLRCARIQKKLTQEELATILGTTTMSIWRWESGKNMPSPFYRTQICTYFRQPPTAFGWPRNHRKVTGSAQSNFLSRMVSYGRRR